MLEAKLGKANLLKKIIDAIRELCKEVNLECRDKVLGVSMESLSKIFKLCDNNDSVTFKSDDDADNVQFVFESEKEDRISDFSLKLLDIEAENLGIPENQQYKGVIKMPSGELMKICRDLKEFGDSITMHCTKDGLKFTVKGDIGTGNDSVRQRCGSILSIPSSRSITSRDRALVGLLYHL